MELPFLIKFSLSRNLSVYELPAISKQRYVSCDAKNQSLIKNMFISTLLIIPWIVFGFRNSDKNFIGLNQTKKSISVLLVTEIIFFLILIFFLKKPDPNIAGQGSFGWIYMFIYEKGIFPILISAEYINGSFGDKIDNNFQMLYLITALLMDYIILKIFSPKTIRLFKTHSS